jgi:uncharacterized protein (DUF433 family)
MRADLYITRDPKIQHGKAVFVGSTTKVFALMEWLVKGKTVDAFLQEHPDVDELTAKAALELAFAKLVDDYDQNAKGTAV